MRLLEGKFGEVEKELKGQMEEAAEALEFEKAAALRDRLRAITLLGKRQKVVAGYLADTDVLGLYMGEVRSGVAVLHFQEGSSPGGTWRSFPRRGSRRRKSCPPFWSSITLPGACCPGRFSCRRPWRERRTWGGCSPTRPGGRWSW